MTRRSLMTAALALGVLGVSACSKTQDTAPEQRLFGTPPSIESVNVAGSNGTASCDITQTFEGFLCTLGLGPDSYTLSPGPALVVDVSYSRIEFDVRVTDPESTAAKSDILLVSASYLTPPEGNQKPEETSLILLDDGSATIFPFRQGNGAGENCTIDIPNGICTCSGAEYNLTSNDPTAGDNMFTRGFAFVAPGAGIPAGVNGFALVENCVAHANHEAPASGTKFLGKTVSFKIEAVDREGNLSTWPTQPAVTIGPSSLTSIGDACAFCLMTSSNTTADPPTGCACLTGVVGVPGSGFETGLCRADFFHPGGCP